VLSAGPGLRSSDLVDGAYFMADTVDYVSAVSLHDRGINYVFWDFRHLFWRPLGWVFLHFLSPWLSPAMRSDPRIPVIYIFLALNWAAGLLSVFLLRAFLRRFCFPAVAIEFSTVAFVFSLAFLNYVHSGSSYIPGLMFLLLGLYLGTRSAEPGASKYLEYGAPLSLAISVCLWFPMRSRSGRARCAVVLTRTAAAQRWPLVLRMTTICMLIRRGCLWMGAAPPGNLHRIWQHPLGRPRRQQRGGSAGRPSHHLWLRPFLY